MTLESILKIAEQQVKQSYEVLQDKLLGLKDKKIEDMYKTPKDLEDTINNGEYLSCLEIAGHYAMQGNLDLFNYFIDMSMGSFMQYMQKNDGKITKEDEQYMAAISLLKLNIGMSYNYIRENNKLEIENFQYKSAA